MVSQQSQVSTARIEVERKKRWKGGEVKERVEGRRKRGEEWTCLDGSGYICRVIPPHNAVPLPASRLPLPVVVWPCRDLPEQACVCNCVCM